MSHRSWREVKQEKVNRLRKQELASVVGGFSLLAHGSHDQKDHGNWARGGVSGEAFDDIPEDAQDDVVSLLRAARAVEPDLTPALQAVAQENGGEMIGLKYRFKKPDGVVEKIGRKVVEKGISHEQAAQGISDALRYTMQLDADRYVEGALDAIKSLEDQGYEFIEIENNWFKGDAYNGVNAVLRDKKTGLKVELQFHTPESWDLKDNVLHSDYEFIRERKGTSAQRLLAHERMRQASDSLEFPPGVEDLCASAGDKCKNVYRPTKETLFASGGWKEWLKRSR